MSSVLIQFPKGIPEPEITGGQADFFFETLHLQPLALNLSFMRTDRVNADEK
jgi:vacuolar protein sorting-associated protein 13A/C